MNRNHHRTVFNQARGQMVAVAENAPARGKVSTASPVKGVASAVCLAIGMMGMASSAYAQISVDNRSARAPEVTAASNGTPLININAASSAGVSINHYTQFNTDTRGVILNNSSTASQTQLGGAIGGNANMANGPASIIVNQVVGSMPSTLNGSIEVAGRRAEVVLSNPNGITVNGAGFINTSRAVITTATVGSSDKNGIKNLQVLKGTLVVNKLDARGVDQVDLIARAVKINGEIHADNILNVVAGHNVLKYRAVDAYADQDFMGRVREGVSIDVAALGGMYAKKISLLGTENGVGVNVAGIVEAKESLRLDSNGNLALGDTARLRGGKINIASLGSLSNSGTVEASGDLVARAAVALGNSKTGVMVSGAQASLASSGAMHNEGTITSKDKLVASAAGELRNALSGVMQGEKNVEVVGKSIDQAGKIAAGSDMLMKTTGFDSLVNSGTLKAGKELDIRSNGGFSNTATGVLSAAGVSVETRRMLSNEGLIEATAGDVDLCSRGKLTNTGTGIIQASAHAQLFSHDDGEQHGQVKGKTVRLVSLQGGFSNTGNVQAADRVSFYARESFENTGSLSAPSFISE